jgi:hypothetical protein
LTADQYNRSQPKNGESAEKSGKSSAECWIVEDILSVRQVYSFYGQADRIGLIPTRVVIGISAKKTRKILDEVIKRRPPTGDRRIETSPSQPSTQPVISVHEDAYAATARRLAIHA